MDMANFKPGQIVLSQADCHRLTRELGDVNQMLATIYQMGVAIVGGCNLEPEDGAIANQSMAIIGCRKVDAVARALGETGFGNFEEEFAPIVLGQGEREV